MYVSCEMVYDSNGEDTRSTEKDQTLTSLFIYLKLWQRIILLMFWWKRIGKHNTDQTKLQSTKYRKAPYGRDTLLAVIRNQKRLPDNCMEFAFHSNTNFQTLYAALELNQRCCVSCQIRVMSMTRQYFVVGFVRGKKIGAQLQGRLTQTVETIPDRVPNVLYKTISQQCRARCRESRIKAYQPCIFWSYDPCSRIWEVHPLMIYTPTVPWDICT